MLYLMYLTNSTNNNFYLNIRITYIRSKKKNIFFNRL